MLLLTLSWIIFRQNLKLTASIGRVCSCGGASNRSVYGENLKMKKWKMKVVSPQGFESLSQVYLLKLKSFLKAEKTRKFVNGNTVPWNPVLFCRCSDWWGRLYRCRRRGLGSLSLKPGSCRCNFRCSTVRKTN